MALGTDAAAQKSAAADEHDYLFTGEPGDLAADWWVLAACDGQEPEIFFPLSPQDVRAKEKAVAICAKCQVREQCLTTAMADRSLVGIWGGTDELDRARLREHTAGR